MRETGWAKCKRCGANIHVIDPHNDIAECSFELQFNKAYISANEIVICNRCAKNIMPIFEFLMNYIHKED